MPEKPPFLVLLLTVSFIALGVLNLLIALTLWFTPVAEEMQLSLILSTLVSVGYILVGYDLYRGDKWGWFVALGLVLVNIVGSILHGTYQELVVDALLFVLLLSTMKYYRVPFGKPARSQPSPVPPPSMPIAVAFSIPKEEKRFVKRKHSY